MPDEHVIKIDAIRFCPHCNREVDHKLTIYSDAEYGICFACKCKTKWIPIRDPETRKCILMVDWYQVDDRSKPISDFKRNDPRRYWKCRDDEEC